YRRCPGRGVLLHLSGQSGPAARPGGGTALLLAACRSAAAGSRQPVPARPPARTASAGAGGQHRAAVGGARSSPCRPAAAGRRRWPAVSAGGADRRRWCAAPAHRCAAGGGAHRLTAARPRTAAPGTAGGRAARQQLPLRHGDHQRAHGCPRRLPQWGADRRAGLPPGPADGIQRAAVLPLQSGGDRQAAAAVTFAANTPRRIVCLTEETTETLYLLGEQDRVVGISGFTVRPPQARKEKPKVSAFTSAWIERILALEPDLVLGFSDIQADIAAE